MLKGHYRVGGERRAHHVDNLLLGLHLDVVHEAGPGQGISSGSARRDAAAVAHVGLRCLGRGHRHDPLEAAAAASLQQGLVAMPQHLLLVLTVAERLLQLVDQHQVAAQLVEHLHDLLRGHGVEVCGAGGQTDRQDVKTAARARAHH